MSTKGIDPGLTCSAKMYRRLSLDKQQLRRAIQAQLSKGG